MPYFNVKLDSKLSMKFQSKIIQMYGNIRGNQNKAFVKAITSWVKNGPGLITPFTDLDKGICKECGESFPMKEMRLVGNHHQDNKHTLDLWCYECLYEFSEGECSTAWLEAGN